MARLAPGVESAGHLGAAEGTVVEVAGIVAGEGNALCDTLVDNAVADLSETVDVGFAGTEIPALDGVVE